MRFVPRLSPLRRGTRLYCNSRMKQTRTFYKGEEKRVEGLFI